MKINSFPKLQEFCREMLEWIDGGCDGNHNYFAAEYGLCYNYRKFLRQAKITWAWSLNHYFIFSYGRAYPFSSSVTYASEVLNGTLYKNAKRLEWLKTNAKEKLK